MMRAGSGRVVGPPVQAVPPCPPRWVGRATAVVKIDARGGVKISAKAKVKANDRAGAGAGAADGGQVDGGLRDAAKIAPLVLLNLSCF